MQVRCRSKSAKYVVMQALNCGQREKKVSQDRHDKKIHIFISQTCNYAIQ